MRLPVLFLAALLATAAWPSHALPHGLGGRIGIGGVTVDIGPGRPAPQPQFAAIGRDGAAAIAQRQTGGRVLSVDRADAGGRAVWRVKVVTPRGDVRIILVDADSGQVL
jgi:hypothetical protein